MIVTHGLTKRDGKTLAVNRLSFTVAPDGCTGVPGPARRQDLPVAPQGEAQSATIGFVLLSGYALAALGLGAALLLRRDA